MKIFHDIPGYNRYEISLTGKVRHKKFKKVLKVGMPLNGYPQVNIHSDVKGRIVSVCVHHLSALVFLGPRPPGAWIRFKDGKKINSHYKNIYYEVKK